MSARVKQSKPLDALPLFASDAEIGAALLGPERAREWGQIAPLLERDGLPKVDPMFGGRYVPAVKAYFDHDYGLAPQAPLAPSGQENPAGWNRTSKRRA